VETGEDLELPPALAAAMALVLDVRRLDPWEHCFDLEPCPAFLSAQATDRSFGPISPECERPSGHFRIFGLEGAGGHMAFWLVRPGAVLTDQPVVFLGSEGEAAVVTRDLSDLLWLLAQGYGPVEAGMPEWRRPGWSAVERPGLVAIAERHAPGRRRPVHELVAAAQREFPDFERFYLGTWWPEATAPAPRCGAERD
jgi:hypothetical protein